MKQSMNDIPVFDPDTLSHAPVGDLLDLLIGHGDRVPRILFDACVAHGEDMVAALTDFYARLGADDERDVWWNEAEILARQERWREEDARALSVADQHDSLFDFPEPYVREQPKPGRNDPCPCGSGMKYKKCCLPADEAREALARQLH